MAANAALLLRMGIENAANTGASFPSEQAIRDGMLAIDEETFFGGNKPSYKDTYEELVWQNRTKIYNVHSNSGKSFASVQFLDGSVVPVGDDFEQRAIVYPAPWPWIEKTNGREGIDYIEFLTDLYNTQNLTNAHNWLYNKQLDALTVDGVMCASGADRGRAGRMNESFIYVNGDGIPENAVNIAGVFDFENDLEMAVFRGMHKMMS